MHLCSHAKRRRRLKRLDEGTGRSLLQGNGCSRRAGREVKGSTGSHKGTGLMKYQKKTHSGREKRGSENRRQTQEIVIQVDISMCDESQDTGHHLYMMTEPLIPLIRCNSEKNTYYTVDYLYFTYFYDVHSLKTKHTQMNMQCHTFILF